MRGLLRGDEGNVKPNAVLQELESKPGPGAWNLIRVREGLADVEGS